jgi:hypothetical protein
MCTNHKTICSYKIHMLQNVNMAQKVYILLYINYMSFIFMMYWYEVCTIYILTKSMQLS